MGSRSTSYHSGPRLASTLALLAAWWLWMPLGALIIWLVKHEVFGGYGQQDQGYVLFLQSDLFPHGSLAGAAPLFWLWVFIGLAGSLVIVSPYRMRRAVRVPVTLALLAAMGLAFAATWAGLWNNDKDLGRYYSQRTDFYVPGMHPAPSSLRALTSTARRGTGGCAFAGTADVASCIRIGPLPDFSFDPRSASYEAASTIMGDSSALASQVNVLGPTVHYLPGHEGGHGLWTAILDGSGTRPTEGVAVWDGQSNTVRICQFQGLDSFNRAFGGRGADSLPNLIAQRFPALIYVEHDISGYCEGTGPDARPVIVMPVTRQVGYRSRTVQAPAGIIVLRGSRSGDPSMSYQPAVRPGEYPNQVYPESIAVAQIDATTWAAGRGELDNSGFGFGLTSVDTNASNPGEYVLRSNADGHFYFVTPLTPRNSGSQAVIAYAVERADEVTSGRLNPVSIYVQSDSANPVSMTVLESRMTTYINQVEPSLLTSGNGGALQEIIPYGTGMWRGFVDIGGVTQDYIDMSGNVNVTPRFFSVSGALVGRGGAGAPGPTGTSGQGSGCGGDPAAMTTSQLADCIQKFAKALGARAKSPSASPSPSHS